MNPHGHDVAGEPELQIFAQCVVVPRKKMDSVGKIEVVATLMKAFEACFHHQDISDHYCI